MKYSYSNMGSYLYSRLPHYHKVVDEQNELLLKRFMEVFNVGFKANDEALKQALETTQASKCGEENLEELAKSLGADWISTIDPSYQRTIVRMLIKLYKQKGTIDTIRFIASELSGFEAKIIEGEIPEEYFEEGDEKKRLLTVKLQAPEMDDPVSAQQHETTISEVIDKFVPVHTKFILVVTYFYDELYYKRVMEDVEQDIKQDFGTYTKSVENEEDNVTILLEDKTEVYNCKQLGVDMRTFSLNDTSCRLVSPIYRLAKISYLDVIKTSKGEVKIYG